MSLANGVHRLNGHADTTAQLLRSQSAERAVLGCIIRENSLLAGGLAHLLPEHFGGYAEQVIFATARALFDQGVAVNEVALAEELIRRRQFKDVGGVLIADLLDAAPTAANAEYYGGIVVEQYQKRRLLLVGQSIVADIEKGRPVAELLDEVRSRLAALPDDAKPTQPKFAAPIPCAALQSSGKGADWLWHGYIARGEVTLLSALWKAGKTTLLAHLLRAFESGGRFCGLDVSAAKILYVTEESEARWAERRDRLALADHCRFIVRPFKTKSRWEEWLEWIRYLEGLQKGEPVDVIIMDTLTSLWPLRDENDACQVQSALQPLHSICAGAALLLIHHLGKTDSNEAKGSRGSGAITAFADTIVEARRYSASDRDDRLRVLSGYGRWDDTPKELVVKLAGNGSEYVAYGDCGQVKQREIRDAIFALLPCEPPGKGIEEITEEWPSGSPPTKPTLLAELRQGTDRGDWRREGEGKKGSPYTFWVLPAW